MRCYQGVLTRTHINYALCAVDCNITKLYAPSVSQPESLESYSCPRSLHRPWDPITWTDNLSFREHHKPRPAPKSQDQCVSAKTYIALSLFLYFFSFYEIIIGNQYGSQYFVNKKELPHHQTEVHMFLEFKPVAFEMISIRYNSSFSLFLFSVLRFSSSHECNSHLL